MKSLMSILIIFIIFSSCKKESDPVSNCYPIRVVVEGNKSEIDKYRIILEEPYSHPYALGNKTYLNIGANNLSLPYDETHELCHDKYRFSISFEDEDSTTVLNVKLFSDGELIREEELVASGFEHHNGRFYNSISGSVE